MPYVYILRKRYTPDSSLFIARFLEIESLLVVSIKSFFDRMAVISVGTFLQFKVSLLTQIFIESVSERTLMFVVGGSSILAQEQNREVAMII
jgi:hypothetical protein